MKTFKGVIIRGAEDYSPDVQFYEEFTNAITGSGAHQHAPQSEVSMENQVTEIGSVAPPPGTPGPSVVVPQHLMVKVLEKLKSLDGTVFHLGQENNQLREELRGIRSE